MTLNEPHRVALSLRIIYEAIVRGQVGENAEAWAQIKLLRNT
jgi:hypothetical protein